MEFREAPFSETGLPVPRVLGNLEVRGLVPSATWGVYGRPGEGRCVYLISQSPTATRRKPSGFFFCLLLPPAGLWAFFSAAVLVRCVPVVLLARSDTSHVEGGPCASLPQPGGAMGFSWRPDRGYNARRLLTQSSASFGGPGPPHELLPPALCIGCVPLPRPRVGAVVGAREAPLKHDCDKCSKILRLLYYG